MYGFMCVCGEPFQSQESFDLSEGAMDTWMAWANEDLSKLWCKRTCIVRAVGQAVSSTSLAPWWSRGWNYVGFPFTPFGVSSSVRTLRDIRNLPPPRWLLPTNLCYNAKPQCVSVSVCHPLYQRGHRYRSVRQLHTAGGCRECHSSAANEDGHDILWYWLGTPSQRTCQSPDHSYSCVAPKGSGCCRSPQVVHAMLG